MLCKMLYVHSLLNKNKGIEYEECDSLLQIEQVPTENKTVVSW